MKILETLKNECGLTYKQIAFKTKTPIAVLTLAERGRIDKAGRENLERKLNLLYEKTAGSANLKLHIPTWIKESILYIQKNHALGVVVVRAGFGKSTTAREFADADIILPDDFKSYTTLSAEHIIIDEANCLNKRQLYFIRRYYEHNDASIVLLGTEELQKKIAAADLAFRSRVSVNAICDEELYLNDIALFVDYLLPNASDSVLRAVINSCENLRQAETVCDKINQSGSTDFKIVRAILKSCIAGGV